MSLDGHSHLCEQYSCIVVEGCVDRFCGRPVERNPYSPDAAFEQFWAWEFGWRDADHLLEQRGREEAARWLQAA